MRRASIPIVPYLDDFLFSCNLERDAIRLAPLLEDDLYPVGFCVNREKNTHESARGIQHWFYINSVSGAFTALVVGRWERLHALITSLILARRGRVQVRTCASMRFVVGPTAPYWTHLDMYRTVYSRNSGGGIHGCLSRQPPSLSCVTGCSPCPAFLPLDKLLLRLNTSR
jgi:hypothetical protein